MKNLITLILVLSFTSSVYAQKKESSFRFNTGFFYYSGQSAEGSEFINYNTEREDGYTNNPYGSKPGLSYGLSYNTTKIYESSVKLGFDIGFEVLRSKINITHISQFDGVATENVSAEGETYLNTSFINMFPSIGYRKTYNSVELDLDFGFDLGYCLSSNEKGSAESSTRSYSTERDRKNIDLDVRPRIQISATKNKIGGYFGYSMGIVNYKSGGAGGRNEAFGNALRFGFIYKLK